MIEDEATVKRYYPEGDTIRFEPANASMRPIIVRKRDWKSVNLLGVVIGIYRKMRLRRHNTAARGSFGERGALLLRRHQGSG